MVRHNSRQIGTGEPPAIKGIAKAMVSPTTSCAGPLIDFAGALSTAWQRVGGRYSGRPLGNENLRAIKSRTLMQ